MSTEKPLCHFFIMNAGELVEVRDSFVRFGREFDDYRLAYHVIVPKQPIIFRDSNLKAILVKRTDSENKDKALVELVEYVLPTITPKHDGLLQNLERLYAGKLLVIYGDQVVSGLGLSERYAGKKSAVIGLDNKYFMNIVDKQLEAGTGLIAAVDYALKTGIIGGLWYSSIPSWFSDPVDIEMRERQCTPTS